MPWNANTLRSLYISSQSWVPFTLISYCHYVKERNQPEGRRAIWRVGCTSSASLCEGPQPDCYGWTDLVLSSTRQFRGCPGTMNSAPQRQPCSIWKRQDEDRLFLSYPWHRNTVDAVLSQMYNLGHVVGLGRLRQVPVSKTSSKAGERGQRAFALLEYVFWGPPPTISDYTATFRG